MHKGIPFILCAAIVAGFGAAVAAELTYPVAPHDLSVTDTYYGVKVPDEYRPLENLDDPAVHAWEVTEQQMTEKYLAAIPQRATIYAALEKAANYEKIGTPTREGNQYFYTYNSGLQNQEVWYTKEGRNGTPRVLIDPNGLSADGTTGVSIHASRDGKLVALGFSQAGFPWTTMRFREVATGRDLPDELKWTKFSLAWTPDGTGVYYGHYDAPKGGLMDNAPVSGEAIYYHKLGTPQSDDIPLYSDPAHNDYIYAIRVTEDGKYIVLAKAQGTNVNNELLYAEIGPGKPVFKPLVGSMDASYEVIDNDGPVFNIVTTLNAPNRRIVAVDTANGNNVREIVPQTNDNLADASTADHKMFLNYDHDVHSLVKEYAYDGTFVRDITLPGVGEASGFDGHRDDTSVYYTFDGYTTPETVYSYDVDKNVTTVYQRPKVQFDPSQYVSKEVFYRSKDGTRVPLFISYRKGLKLNGQNPTIVYGYGGFDISTSPSFSTNVAVWLRMGGVYAVANIRGGSEYGEAWHKGGMVLTKQNVFDDFNAAAQYLIDNKYTSNKRIAAKGGSNGGLLVGAVETQRPDLWGAALPEVGVLDMLRYHLWTDGKWWIPDYGCSTCSEDQFKVLYSYSPYANIKKGTHYPATLVETSDHDQHVLSAHSLKFAARLQQAQGGDAPILLRVETNSGHGASSLLKNLQGTADEYAFLVKNFNFTPPSNF